MGEGGIDCILERRNCIRGSCITEIFGRNQKEKISSKGVCHYFYLFIYLFFIFFLFVRFIYFTNIFNKKNLQKKYKKGKEGRSYRCSVFQHRGRPRKPPPKIGDRKPNGFLSSRVLLINF
ncbi:hypothetical protein V6Z12_A12G283300 [Gossypium hirsutum]